MTSSNLPLTGIHVVELRAIGPVPFAGRLLRQLGAEVTLICPPRPSLTGIPLECDPLESDKRVVMFDLKKPAGRDGLLSLLASSDVLIEGFRPGTLERLDLGPSVLRADHPALVIGRCGGWGQTNPRETTAGHDINFLALAGVLGAIGPVDHPCPPLNLVGDFGGAAMHLALGVVAALMRAKTTGIGSVVQTSIFEATVSLTAHLHGLLNAGLWEESRESNLLDGGAPFYRCYRTADERWLAVGAIEPKFFAELVARLNADVDVTRQHDRTYWPAIHVEFSRCIAQRSRDEWAVVFAQSDACASPVLGLAEARSHADTAFAFDNNAPRSGLTFLE